MKFCDVTIQMKPILYGRTFPQDSIHFLGIYKVKILSFCVNFLDHY